MSNEGSNEMQLEVQAFIERQVQARRDVAELAFKAREYGVAHEIRETLRQLIADTQESTTRVSKRSLQRYVEEGMAELERAIASYREYAHTLWCGEQDHAIEVFEHRHAFLQALAKYVEGMQ